MRLGRDRPKTHRAGTKPLYDVCRRFDFFEGDCGSGNTFTQLHQPTQRATSGRLRINPIRELFKRFEIVLPSRALQGRDRFGLPGVLAPTGAPMVFARIGQGDHVVARHLGIPQFMSAQRFISKHVKTHALQTTGRLRETQINHIVSQAHRLKNLRALI